MPAIYSEPFVNTSVLQIHRPVLQITVPLANGIDLRMGHPSYKYRTSCKYFWCFYTLHIMLYTALFNIIYYICVFFIPGAAIVRPHLSEARNSFKIFYLLYI
jgi:hypothetical protein